MIKKKLKLNKMNKKQLAIITIRNELLISYSEREKRIDSWRLIIAPQQTPPHHQKELGDDYKVTVKSYTMTLTKVACAIREQTKKNIIK